MTKALWAAVAATMLLAGCPADERPIEHTTINNPPPAPAKPNVTIINPPAQVEKKVEIHHVNPPAGNTNSTTTTTTTESGTKTETGH